MKLRLVLPALLLLGFCSARAGSVETHFTPDQSADEKTPLDLFSLQGGYVFSSELTDDRFSYGDQDVADFSLEYVHRFHLGGKFYFGAGVSYGRFEFGDSAAPVPNHLQSLAGVFSINYMVGADRGAFLEVRPGFYTQNDFDSSSFDIPITAARAFVLQRDKIFLIIGANVAFLRGQYPVLPVAGLIWHFSDQWVLYGVVPEPRLTYSPNKNFSVFVGGQLTGGSYRTDRNNGIFPTRLNGAAVDYSDYRASGGLTWQIANRVSLDLIGGYSITRRINFERAGYEYTSDPAPYVRAAFTAEF